MHKSLLIVMAILLSGVLLSGCDSGSVGGLLGGWGKLGDEVSVGPYKFRPPKKFKREKTQTGARETKVMFRGPAFAGAEPGIQLSFGPHRQDFSGTVPKWNNAAQVVLRGLRRKCKDFTSQVGTPTNVNGLPAVRVEFGGDFTHQGKTKPMKGVGYLLLDNTYMMFAVGMDFGGRAASSVPKFEKSLLTIKRPGVSLPPSWGTGSGGSSPASGAVAGSQGAFPGSSGPGSSMGSGPGGYPGSSHPGSAGSSGYPGSGPPGAGGPRTGGLAGGGRPGSGSPAGAGRSLGPRTGRPGGFPGSRIGPGSGFPGSRRGMSGPPGRSGPGSNPYGSGYPGSGMGMSAPPGSSGPGSNPYGSGYPGGAQGMSGPPGRSGPGSNPYGSGYPGAGMGMSGPPGSSGIGSNPYGSGPASSDRGSERSTAVDAQRRAEKAERARQLASAASDPSDPEYFQANRELLRIGSRAQRDEVLKRLADHDPTDIPDSEERKQMARALRNAAEDSQLSISTRRDAISVLVDWTSQFSVPVLNGLLSDENRLIQLDALEHLAAFQDERSIQAVTELFVESAALRSKAADCLREYGQAAEEPVLKLSRPTDVHLTRSTVQLLGDIGAQQSLDAFGKLRELPFFALVKKDVNQASAKIRERIEGQ
jgi:hypothetical protein